MSLPDILGPGLRVVFCGPNPSPTAVAAGRHFADGTNRFWKVLQASGFTSARLSPARERDLLDEGLGLASVVYRPTPRAAAVASAEYRAAANDLERRIRSCAPACVAFLGKTPYVAIHGGRPVAWGRQADPFAGAVAWILPDPSGRNRAFQTPALVEAYRALRLASHAGFVVADGDPLESEAGLRS